MSTTTEFTRVRGSVVVLARDRRRRITRIGLRTLHAGVFHVLDTPIAEFLRDFIGEVVVVTGEVVFDDPVHPSLRAYGFDPVQSDGTVAGDQHSEDFEDTEKGWA